MKRMTDNQKNQGSLVLTITGVSGDACRYIQDHMQDFVLSVDLDSLGDSLGCERYSISLYAHEVGAMATCNHNVILCAGGDKADWDAVCILPDELFDTIKIM